MIRAPIIAVIIALVAGLWILSGNYGDDPQSSEPIESSAVTAQSEQAMLDVKALPRVQVVSSIATSKIREIKLYGRTEPERTVDIKAETAGKIIAISKIEGSIVNKGVTLVRLSMNSRAAKLNEAKAQVKLHEISYDAAQALTKKQFVSEVKLAEEFAALESAKASLSIVQLDIARTRIKSPFQGTLEKLPLEVGDYVNVGDSVAHIVDLDPIVVAVEVTEREISQVKIGHSVLVGLLSGEMREGVIGYISRSANAQTRTFRVEVKLDNPDYEIPEGMTADVTMMSNPVPAHKISPAILTLDALGVLGVKTIDASNTVQFFKAYMVVDTPDGIWITGLPEKVRFISVGQEFVKVGQVVEALESQEQQTP